jgi:hypothetical protein
MRQISKLHYLHFSEISITGAIFLDIFENFISLKQEEKDVEVSQQDGAPSPFSNCSNCSKWKFTASDVTELNALWFPTLVAHKKGNLFSRLTCSKSWIIKTQNYGSYWNQAIRNPRPCLDRDKCRCRNSRTAQWNSTDAKSTCMSSFSFLFYSVVYCGYENTTLWNTERILWMPIGLFQVKM